MRLPGWSATLTLRILEGLPVIQEFLESFPSFEALFVRNFPLQNCESEQL